MSEYMLIDVSKHNEENRKVIRESLLSQGLIISNGYVTESGAFQFEVVRENVVL
jgi:hypothetical protein